MSPNDLDAYLKVLVNNQVGAAVLRLPGGAEISVNFIPQIPVQVGTEPTAGGWKSPQHLDNVEELRPDFGEHQGSLP